MKGSGRDLRGRRWPKAKTHGLLERAGPILLVILLVLTLLPTVSARAPNKCVECHDDYYQYVDILQGHEDTVFPDAMERGETTEVTVVVENYCSSEVYSELGSVNAELMSFNGNIDIAKPEKSIRGMDAGMTEFSWTVECLAQRPDVLTVKVIALNDHEDTSLVDEYSVLVNAPVSLSSYSVEVGAEGTETITIRARENLSDISLAVDDDLAVHLELSDDNIGDMDVGSESDVEFTNLGRRGASGWVELEWTDEDGNSDTFPIRVEMFGDSGGGGGSGKGARYLGRIIGWVGLVLLVTSIVLGGFPRQGRSRLSKWTGSAKRRVRIHCLISYEILLVTLIHAVLLMFGHWDFIVAGNFFLWAQTSFASGIYIDLGTISLVLMAFVGLSGALQKYFMKAMGPKPWRYSHLVLSLTALVLVIVHAVMVGTSFKPVFG